MTIMITLTLIGFAQEALAAAANPEAASSYGTIFIEDQREFTKFKWKFDLGYEYEVSQSYLEVHGFKVSAVKMLGAFVGVGFLTKFYQTQKNETARLLDENLRQYQVTQGFDEPKSSLYALLDTSPLFGHLNFWGGSPLRFEFGVQLGLGNVFYSFSSTAQNRFAILWALKPKLFISNQLAFQLGVGQEIESPFSGDDRLNRLQMGLDLSIGI